MKMLKLSKISALFCFLLSCSIQGMAFGGELTGAGARALLVRNGIDPTHLEQNGAKIIAGELTGAGKTIDIQKIKFFMTKTEVFPMEEVRHVELNPASDRRERDGRTTRRTLSDVKFLEVNEKRIPQSQIEGLVIRLNK